MTYLPGKFVWFEHLSNDVEKSRSFYGELFGWHTDAVPVGDRQYPMIRNGADGIGGFGAAQPGVPSHWMAYLSVADVDTTAKAAQAAGGRIVMPPTDFGPMGRAAALADPAGAMFSIWRGTQGDREDTSRIAIGDWFWNECGSTDAAASLAFYEKVFGYTHTSKEMGGEVGTYHILLKGDIPRAGLMQMPTPGAPSAWVPYVHVEDCEASLARAQSLGARVIVPGTDVPEVGRFGIVMDPAGGVIGVIRGVPMPS